MHPVGRTIGPTTKNFGRACAVHQMFVIGTLTILDTASGPSGASLTTDAHLAPYLTTHALASLKNSPAYYFRPPHRLTLEHADAALRQLMAARVPVLAGTDAPTPGTWYGASIHRELELLVRGGMRPTQALAAATSVPARVFQLADRGRIAPGLRADLLLVEGDPTREIRATRAIAAVWKAGERVNRLALRDT